MFNNQVKFSRISNINIGDVLISDAINFMHNKFFSRVFCNFDILLENFDISDRILETKVTTLQTKMISKNRGAFYSQIILAIKKIIFITLHNKKFESIIKNSSFVVIGGGNLLSDKNGCDLLFRSAYIIKIAKKYNKPVIVYGVGVGPFQFNSHALRSLIDISEEFYVRDSKSLSICMDNSKSAQNLHLTTDPAFVISDMNPKLILEQKYIGINVMNYNIILNSTSFDIAKVAQNVIRLATYYGLGIKIINTAYGDDYTLSKLLYSRIRESGFTDTHIFNIKYSSDLPEAFSNLRFFLASRMHSSIFAMSYEIPTVIYPWQNKVEFLYRDLGLSETVLISSQNFDFDAVVNKFENYTKNVNLSNTINSIKSSIYSDYYSVFSKYVK